MNLHHGVALPKTHEAKQHSKFERTREKIDPLQYLQLSMQLLTPPTPTTGSSHHTHHTSSRGQKDFPVLVLLPLPLGTWKMMETSLLPVPSTEETPPLHQLKQPKLTNKLLPKVMPLRLKRLNFVHDTNQQTMEESFPYYFSVVVNANMKNHLEYLLTNISEI